MFTTYLARLPPPTQFPPPTPPPPPQTASSRSSMNKAWRRRKFNERNQRSKKDCYRTPDGGSGRREEETVHRTDRRPTHPNETTIQDPIGRGPKASNKGNADNRYAKGKMQYYRHAFTEQFTKETVADYLQQQGPRYSASTPRVPSFLTSINPHKTCSPYAMQEHRLLDIQNTVREEEWAGWDDAPASASFQDLYTRKTVLEYLEDTPAWAPEDELIMVHEYGRMIPIIIVLLRQVREDINHSHDITVVFVLN